MGATTAGPRGKAIAYTMSRFPKLSETFILNEITEIERLGSGIELFPLQREDEPVVHPEARRWVGRAHFSPFVSPRVLAAQLYWLRKRPRAYLGVWWSALAGNARSRKFLLRALAIVPQAAHFARQMEAADVGHIHAHWATHPALSAYVIHRLTGIPYSFTAHSTDIYVDRTMLGEKLAHATFVVTISAYNQSLLHEWYPRARGKVVVVHCGVDPGVFAPRRARARGGTFTILCVARLLEVKGHPYLLQSCARLKAQGVRFRCLLVGDGPDRAEIEAQVRELGLEDCVELLGAQPQHVVSDLMATSDVVVLTSRTTSRGQKEGIPVVLMEAMATGLPVVASELGAIPELVDHQRTGLLVPERDVVAIADALGTLCEDPAYAERLGEAGRRKVLDEFDLRKNAATLHRLLTADWSGDINPEQYVQSGSDVFAAHEPA